MNLFFILIAVALVFWFLGRYDYHGLLKFQRDVIRDTLLREDALIDKVKELQSEIVCLKAPQK